MPDFDRKPWSTVLEILGRDVLPIVLIISPVSAMVIIALANYVTVDLRYGKVVEERADRFRVDAFSAAARPEARVVELASVRFPQAAEDLLGAER